MKAKIRVFRAIDDHATCLRYVDEHRMVLESYGVTKVTSASMEWMENPYTYVVVVESENGDHIYGGGRIQIRTPEMPMPMEDAVAELDTGIYQYVNQIGHYQVAEFCGLFNSREVAGYGIGSIFLGRVGVAICHGIGIKHLMALCSPATLRNCLNVGFEIIRVLGNNGTFYYPKEDLIATALIINDLDTLPTASPVDRARILDMRADPFQRSIEKGPKGELEIFYNIEIKHKLSV